MKRILLIDGDPLVYQVGLTAEQPIEWGESGMWTLHADFEECKGRLKAKIEGLLIDLKADGYKIALSCSTVEGFRRGICPTYKANRNSTRKPVVHSALRQLIIDEYDAIMRPGLEADDILGILATQPVKGEERIMVSIDKDFNSVPGLFYNTNKPELGIVTITPEMADTFFALQTLHGDAVDGYAGIPGCGPKTAAKILAGVSPSETWPVILEAYKKAGLAASEALLTARLARILRFGEFNLDTNEVILWTPPESAASPSETATQKSPSKSPKKA